MKNTIDTLLKSMHCVGILITDNRGDVIQVDDGFYEDYGVSSKDLLHKNVYDLEKERIFYPSSAALVLKDKKEITIIQDLKNGKKAIVTAVPLFDNNNEIEKVITFSRDFSSLTKLDELYSRLHRKIEQYDEKLGEIAYEKSIIEDFTTQNKNFQEIIMSVQRIAKYDINILIQGETGVGKTLLAKRIHSVSPFKNGRFVEINCGAMPENLIESELFGYEKGAFSGASNSGKIGLFEAATDGTLFLDEISELPYSSQVKLLKVLQDQTVRRVGGVENIPVHCRVISASNKNLIDEVNKGTFRQDLLYRLNTVTFTIPPIRKRREDIIYLSNHILSIMNKKHELNKRFDSSVFSFFLDYSWPGNIRELENTIQHMAITCTDDIITSSNIPDYLTPLAKTSIAKIDDNMLENVKDLQKSMETVEKKIVEYHYHKTSSSTELGKALNISQSSAMRKINKYIKGR